MESIFMHFYRHTKVRSGGLVSKNTWCQGIKCNLSWKGTRLQRATIYLSDIPMNRRLDTLVNGMEMLPLLKRNITVPPTLSWMPLPTRKTFGTFYFVNLHESARYWHRLISCVRFNRMDIVKGICPHKTFRCIFPLTCSGTPPKRDNSENKGNNSHILLLAFSSISAVFGVFPRPLLHFLPLTGCRPWPSPWPTDSQLLLWPTHKWQRHIK